MPTAEIAGARVAAAPAAVAPVSPLDATLRAARLAIAVVLLVAVALNAALTWRSAVATDRLRQREIDLVRQARILEGEIPQLQNAGRGFLLTQDPRFVDELRRGEEQSQTALARLRDLVHTDPGRELVGTIEAGLAGLIGGIEQRVSLAGEGRLDEARLTFAETDVDRRTLMETVETLVAREERLLLAALDDLQRERVVGLLLGAGLLAAVGLLASRNLAVGRRAVATTQAGLRDASDARDRALTALQATMREREALIASISHDLKNPLTTIQGQAQLLRRRVRSATAPEPERIGEGLATIDATAKKLARLIDELGDTAQLQMGRSLDLHPRPTDFAALVRQAVAEYEGATERHQVRLEAPAEGLAGIWDEARLERVIGNLLSNAVKYSPDGGEVLVRLRLEGDQAVLEVRDQGVGIPAADLPRVFDRYYRAGNVVGAVDGSGLGLAGARQIVEGHGGTITVTSQLGVGSVFTVRLPLNGAGEAR